MIWNHLSVEHPTNAQFHFCGIPNFSWKNWRIIIFSTSISHKFEQVNICENSHLCCKLEGLKFGGGKKNFKEYDLMIVINMDVSKNSWIHRELYI